MSYYHFLKKQKKNTIMIKRLLEMIIKYCSEKDLKKALKETNKLFDNNIIFNSFQRLSRNRIRVTLRVKDSKGKGARKSLRGRRLISACWHVHGSFFYYLIKTNEKAIIETMLWIYNKDNIHQWVDADIGTFLEPLYYSEACDCDNDLVALVYEKTCNPITIYPRERWFT